MLRRSLGQPRHGGEHNGKAAPVNLAIFLRPSAPLRATSFSSRGLDGDPSECYRVRSGVISGSSLCPTRLSTNPSALRFRHGWSDTTIKVLGTAGHSGSSSLPKAGSGAVQRTSACVRLLPLNPQRRTESRHNPGTQVGGHSWGWIHADRGRRWCGGTTPSSNREESSATTATIPSGPGTPRPRAPLSARMCTDGPLLPASQRSNSRYPTPSSPGLAGTPLDPNRSPTGSEPDQAR